MAAAKGIDGARAVMQIKFKPRAPPALLLLAGEIRLRCE